MKIRYFKGRSLVTDLFVLAIFLLFASIFFACSKKPASVISPAHHNPIVYIKITGGGALYNYQIGGIGLSGHISGDQTFQVASNYGDDCIIYAVNDSSNRNIYIDVTLSDGPQYHIYGTGKQTITFTSQ